MKYSASLILALLLTACGGGSGGDNPSDAPVVQSDPVTTPTGVIDNNPIATDPIAGECIDFAPLNDGIGWNGVSECDLPISADPDPISGELPQTVPVGGQPVEETQTQPVEQAGECIDFAPLNDGIGWNGVSECDLPISADPDPISGELPQIVPQVNYADYSCETINGNNQHSLRLWEDHSASLDWYIQGDSVWVVTRQNGGIQPYRVTQTGLAGENPQLDRGNDYVQNCDLQASSNHDWLLNSLPNSFPLVQPLVDQVTYSCSLDADSSTAWTWVVRTDNKMYDLEGEQVGRWAWFSDGDSFQLNPSGNPSPGLRFEGIDLVLSDSRGGDYGKCIADKQIPQAQLTGLFEYPLVHCHIYGDQQFLVFAPSGQLMSQYGVNLGSWQALGDNFYEFKGITWEADDQGTLKGTTGERLEEFCSTHNGRTFYNR